VLAIIGGSGLTRLPGLEVSRRQNVPTPYGEASSALTFGAWAGKEVVFLARHGDDHTIPPHEVNYRANIWALHAQGVKKVLAVASVGGIRADLTPGVLAVPDQIIDYTHGRAATFVASGQQVDHVDFTHPYCAELRAACLAAARHAGEPIIDGGVYAATQGPRLETAAEINRLERDGADMVGMTGMPEAALAREIGLCYAVLAVVVNAAAGRDSSRAGIVMSDVKTVMATAMLRAQAVLEQWVKTDGG